MALGIKPRGKKNRDKKGRRPDQDAAIEMPRVLSLSYYLMVFIALAIPNLIFSGPYWFDTLHIMKWTFAMVPVAAVSFFTGIFLLIYGKRTDYFKVDGFGLIWILMLAYITLQALWVDISSWSTYWKEWFYFATLIGMYIYSYNMFKNEFAHKAILLCSGVNASLNVLFAELVNRGLAQSVPFIMWVPGNYIGNTGQQEMFGLWMAMALMNGIYLHVAFWSKGKGLKHELFRWGNIFLIAVNAWGLWNSTARGGIFSLITGIIALGLTILRNQGGDRERLKRMGHVALAILVMLAATIAVGKTLGAGRASILVTKVESMVLNPKYLAGRGGIWRTSAVMIKQHWLKGVGIGHYKWHYLDSQRESVREHGVRWQFTYWAHSEYLQWWAEFGIFGMIVLLGAAIWWLWSFVCALIQKKTLSIEASWACAMTFLICFDAIFSRPFHRIENVLWLSFAFAVANREILIYPCRESLERSMGAIRRAVGALSAVIAAAGVAYLITGLIGDQYLWNAMATNSARLRQFRIEKAMAMPMARDDAVEAFAKYKVEYAKVTRKREDWIAASKAYYRAFMTQPRGMVLVDAANTAKTAGDAETFNELYDYLRRNEEETAALSNKSGK